MPKLTTNLLGVSILALIFAPAVDAQVLTAEDSGNSIHWAYSAFFGTGAYRVGDEQDIFVIRVPPKWQIRTSDDEKFGIDLEFPVTVGVHNFDFDDILDDFVPTDLQQISVVPTVKLDMPMGPRWTLRPLASLGWGTELSGGESAWIYNAGLRSRVSFAPGRFELGLLNGLEWYGYTPDKGKSNDLSRLMTGLEVDHPMGKLQLGGDPLWLKTHVIHYWYFDELDFFFSDRPVVELARELEIAVTFGKEKKIRIWRLSLDRVGLAYRFTNSDSSVQAEGLRLVFSSAFK